MKPRFAVPLVVGLGLMSACAEGAGGPLDIPAALCAPGRTPGPSWPPIRTAEKRKTRPAASEAAVHSPLTLSAQHETCSRRKRPPGDHRAARKTIDEEAYAQKAAAERGR